MPTDYSHWLTKQQAAEAIGVSTKTIEKMADENKLQQGTLRRPGRPAIAVYHPDDVERVRKERNPDAEAFILPPGADSQPEPKALAVAASQNSQNPLEMFAAMAAAVRPTERVRIAERLFLTLDEAVDYSGLPKGYLRELISQGKLGAKIAGRWRIRRVDLEKL